MFTNNFRRGREDSSQLCVYVGGERVVDLWASLSDPTYTADTLTNVFSSTKSLTAIALAGLQDRGLFNYTDKGLPTNIENSNECLVPNSLEDLTPTQVFTKYILNMNMNSEAEISCSKR